MESRSGERYASKITKERKADVTKNRREGRQGWRKRQGEKKVGKKTWDRNIDGEKDKEEKCRSKDKGKEEKDTNEI